MPARLPLACLAASLLAALPAAAQPTLYTGLGLGTHLGGLVGVGVEVPVTPYAAANAAVGLTANPAEMRRDGIEGVPIGFDAGVKVFPAGGSVRSHRRVDPFVGLNYGVVNAWYGTAEGGGMTPLQTVYAVSYTLGARATVVRRVQLSAYVGATSKPEENRLFDAFFPRMGVLVGYRL